MSLRCILYHSRLTTRLWINHFVSFNSHCIYECLLDLQTTINVAIQVIKYFHFYLLIELQWKPQNSEKVLLKAPILSVSVLNKRNHKELQVNIQLRALMIWFYSTFVVKQLLQYFETLVALLSSHVLCPHASTDACNGFSCCTRFGK